jgi:hypothetical protein
VLLLGAGLQALLTLCASVFSLALAQDKNRAITKFKIRCSKYLYTLVIKDEVRTLRARAAPRRAWSHPRAVRQENACERGLRTGAPLSLAPADARLRRFPLSRSHLRRAPQDKAKKLMQSLPPGLQRFDLPKKA